MSPGKAIPSDKSPGKPQIWAVGGGDVSVEGGDVSVGESECEVEGGDVSLVYVVWEGGVYGVEVGEVSGKEFLELDGAGCAVDGEGWCSHYPTAIILAKKNAHVVAIPPRR
ncbi:hypothetical protein Tco_1140371 [Tanacetum coccineum]